MLLLHGIYTVQLYFSVKSVHPKMQFCSKTPSTNYYSFLLNLSNYVLVNMSQEKKSTVWNFFLLNDWIGITSLKCYFQ